MSLEVVKEKLNWACKFYCDWYDGSAHRQVDASQCAYELVSAIRDALKIVREAQENLCKVVSYDTEKVCSPPCICPDIHSKNADCPVCKSS